MSACLAMHLLGPPQMEMDGSPILVDRRSGVALLAYLAVEDLQRTGQRYSREFLSGLLWPNYDQANAYSNLRHCLWEIQRSLSPNWIKADRTSVEISAQANLALDVARFQEIISQVRQQPDMPRRIPLLVEAASLYRNHFLTGFSLRDASEFNDWVYLQAENYRGLMIEVLNMLVEATSMQGQPETAVPYARRLVAFDPLNEAAHRQLMQVYLQAGQHSAALQQYQSCEKILRKELGLDPQPETRELYKRIRKGESRPVAFPKPVISSSPPHNLPVQLTSFIGREKERNQVCDLLAGQRLVTLNGTGGIGKTRLALQVGQRLLSEYPDGVWFLALDTISDPNQVPQSLAAVFHLRQLPTRSVTKLLTDVLSSRKLLLIMDNCEHLRDACARLITALLAGCPQIKTLATSREVLGVEGETIYGVPSLSLPEAGDAAALVPGISDFEALRLFTARAGLILHTFELSQENVGAVTAICRRLDGIPLAIELAAARLDILLPQEILAQLNASFELLVRRGFAEVPRHQSMRASMDWSWGLLSEAERQFLRRLSVFVGGWTLEAAQKICNDQALLLLDALAAKSLIVVQGVEGGVTRYRLHEIVRQYASEKLGEVNDVEVVRERHLQYFLSLAEQAEPALHGRSFGEWLKRLTDEHGNLCAALDWAEKTDVQAGLQILSWLRLYWGNDVCEAVRWLDVFLNKPDVKAYPADYAYALSTQSGFLNLLQQVDAARHAAQAGLDLARLCGDRRVELDLLLGLSNSGGTAEHKEFGQRALSLAQALNDPWREALALVSLAWDHSDYSRAFVYWEKAVQLFRKLGDTGSLMTNLVDLGFFEFNCGDYESAQHSLDEAILISEELDLPFSRAAGLFSRGIIAMMNGDLDQAHACLQEAADLTEVTGDRLDTFFQRTRLGHLAVKQGEISEARTLFGRSAREFLADRSEIGLAYTFEGIAALNVTVGRHAIAAGLIGWADAVRIKTSDRRPDLEQADIDRLISACVLKMGEEAFSEAYDAGQAMLMDNAVTYAMEPN